MLQILHLQSQKLISRINLSGRKILKFPHCIVHAVIEEKFVKSQNATKTKRQFSVKSNGSCLDILLRINKNFVNLIINFAYKLQYDCVHTYTHCRNYGNLLSLKKYFVLYFFSKTVTFTKFLPKMRESEFSRNFHTVLHEYMKSLFVSLLFEQSFQGKNND